MKLLRLERRLLVMRRAPRGARGLKLGPIVVNHPRRASRPARGAWIETAGTSGTRSAVASRPARGAWIETRNRCPLAGSDGVAPRAGRVD